MSKKYTNLVKDYYGEISNLTVTLNSLTNSYRLLVASAAELNNINEAKSSAVKEAVKRSEKLGHCIDHLITLIDECADGYYQYCLVVNKYINTKESKDAILTEVNDDLSLQNSTVRPNEDS